MSVFFRQGEPSSSNPRLSIPVFLPGQKPVVQLNLPGWQAASPSSRGIAYGHIDTGGMRMLFTIFKGRRILIIGRLPEHLPGGAGGLETDILVLVDNVSCNLDSLIHVFNPGLVIVDGSNHSRYHAEMERACIRHGIPFHSTEKDGFYVF